jgi:hypothetical protein
MTSDHLLEAIRSQYPATQGWIVLPQVANATGAGRGRTSDALAMNGWPSRGLELVGFEIKVTRQDWRRELEQPEKADPIYQYCDGWYLVTPDDVVVVRGQELPSTWGHLVAGRQGVKVVKVATKLQPKPMDRSFLAAIIRRLVACETPDAKLTIAREAGRKDGGWNALESSIRRRTSASNTRSTVCSRSSASPTGRCAPFETSSSG